MGSQNPEMSSVEILFGQNFLKNSLSTCPNAIDSKSQK